MEIIPNIIELIDGEPRVSHIDIAEYSDNKKKSVQDLITRNIEDFKEFGNLAILNRGVVNGGKGEQPKVYFLNEQQATLLMTYLRNSVVVKNFKKQLVKQFFQMKNQLQNKNSEPTPQPQKVDLVRVLDDTRSSIELIREVFSYTPFEMVQLDQSAKKRGEVSPIELFGIDLSDLYLLPTELGKLIGKTAMETNLLLAQKGYQIRVNGVWTLTEKGEAFGIQLENRYQQIKWKVTAVL